MIRLCLKLCRTGKEVVFIEYQHIRDDRPIQRRFFPVRGWRSLSGSFPVERRADGDVSVYRPRSSQARPGLPKRSRIGEPFTVPGSIEPFTRHIV